MPNLHLLPLSVIYQPSGRAREYAPLAANLYTGCGHRCTYCYVPGVMRIERGKFDSGAYPRKDILKKFSSDCRILDELSERHPVFFSFTTDPYNPTELNAENPIMRQAIEICKTNRIPVQILTKAGLRATRDFDLLQPGDAIASTLTLADEDQSRKWEPAAALPADRIALLKAAKEKGFKTWASLEPVIDPDQTLELIRLSMPYADLFKIGKLNHNQSGIDWRNFAWRAIALLEENQKDFYVKKDLQKFVDFPHAGLSIEEIEKRNIQFFPPHYRAYLPIQPTA